MMSRQAGGPGLPGNIRLSPGATTTTALINISQREGRRAWEELKQKLPLSVSLSLPGPVYDLIYSWCIRCLMQCLIDVSTPPPPSPPVYFIPPAG